MHILEHIKDILPSAIQQLTKNKVEYYKRQANHYAKLYIKNGNFASEYKRDYGWWGGYNRKACGCVYRLCWKTHWQARGQKAATRDIATICGGI